MSEAEDDASWRESRKLVIFKLESLGDAVKELGMKIDNLALHQASLATGEQIAKMEVRVGALEKARFEDEAVAKARGRWATAFNAVVSLAIAGIGAATAIFAAKH